MFTKYFKLPAFAKSCSLNCEDVTLDRVRREPWNLIGDGNPTAITYLNKLKWPKEFSKVWMVWWLARNLHFSFATNLLQFVLNCCNKYICICYIFYWIAILVLSFKLPRKQANNAFTQLPDIWPKITTF